jgi:hypothetical protein
MRTIGIIQPNYIPWRGYFDFVHEVDVFVHLDDVQYTPRDWRSRNKIKQPDGSTRWLTVPVTGGRNQLIKDVRIDNTQKWARKHLQALRHSYGKAPYFKDYVGEIEDLYAADYEYLVDLNYAFTERIAAWLDISTRFAFSSDLEVQGTKDDRLIALVQKLDGDCYLSGPAARDYMQPQLWRDADIEVSFKSYEGYPEYDQISEPFEPAVSVLDLLFSVGPQAPNYIWGEFRESSA